MKKKAFESLLQIINGITPPTPESEEKIFGLDNEVPEVILNETGVYQMPVRVGVSKKPVGNQKADYKNVGEGVDPWMIGHFYPGKYLNETHPGGHNGVDFAAPKGTPIYPIAPGIVLEAGNRPERAGIFVKLGHELDENGKPKVTSFYGHMNSSSVSVNQEVTLNMMIGTVGATGNARGSNHLHHEVWVDGKVVDPMSVYGKPVGSLYKKACLIDKIIKMANLFSTKLKAREELKP